MPKDDGSTLREILANGGKITGVHVQEDPDTHLITVNVDVSRPSNRFKLTIRIVGDADETECPT